MTNPTTPEKSTVETGKVESTPIETQVQPTKIENNKAVQFGIIFSAGGVRTWAYVNVLKEIQKYKLPVAAVAGMEWGSVAAGIYAQNISANEVEWELSKFKNSDDSSDFIKKIFEKKSTETLKIPFGCL